MIKFILHGGNTKIINQDNDNFFREMTISLKGNIKIILNYFAKDESKWNDLYKEDVQRILNVNKNKKINFEVADKKIFADQTKKTDVIYFRGGDTFLLKNNLKNIKNLNILLKNKIVAGSSAGVYILSKYFYENDQNKLGQGLGILNFKTFCHFDESKLNLVEKLRNYKEKDLEILILPDFKYQVIYK